MSAGAIITVISNLPWAQVVDSAPKVAEGASKLWRAVTRFGKPPLPSLEAPVSSDSEPPSDIEVLGTRVHALEEMVKNHQDQMQSSSELIKALADQNTQLIQRIELAQVRLGRLVVASASCGLLLVVAMTYLLVRQ